MPKQKDTVYSKQALDTYQQVSLHGEFRVSQSKVKQWRKCHYSYHLRYPLGLKKKVKSRSLQVGTIIHKMLDADAEGNDPMLLLKQIGKDNAKLFSSQREEYGEIIDDIRQIMTEYFNYWSPKDFTNRRINKRSGEYKFEIDMFGGDVCWTGTVDKIGYTQDKLNWIGETKSFKRRPDDGARWRSIQSATYIRAVRELGWCNYEIEGMMWDYIHNKPPTKPALLKAGGISEKNINTLPITIRETFKELGLEPKLFKSYIKRHEDRLDEWFFRIYTPVDNSVVDHLFEDFTMTIQEMMAGHGKVKDKNVEVHCNWCDYNSICQAELEGNDVDYVIEKEFERGTTDDYEPAITTED